jgi:hypothetical protein
MHGTNAGMAACGGNGRCAGAAVFDRNGALRRTGNALAEHGRLRREWPLRGTHRGAAGLT